MAIIYDKFGIKITSNKNILKCYFKSNKYIHACNIAGNNERSLTTALIRVREVRREYLANKK